ncbi:MAG: ABC transporter permease [Bacteroidetes bacterium]|nr:ABC transporter permease [Bacteroidota bacterium]
MKKISIIIRREYLSRVRKKSFVVMTILGPILMAALMIVPIYISKLSDDTKVIGVIDEGNFFYKRFPDSESIKFDYLNSDLIASKENFKNGNHYALLYIPKTIINSPNAAQLFSDKQPSINVKIYIESLIKKELEDLKLSASGIDKDILASIKTDVNVTTFKLREEGTAEKSNTEITTVLGLFGGILIYFFIFLFGSQVMRGVIEEKTSRIIEVIVSSVKPFQLMMGKIIGVAMVGLTQFLLWIILTFGIVTAFQSFMHDKKIVKKSEISYNANSKMLDKDELKNLNTEKKDANQIKDLKDILGSINFGTMIAMFIFYFLGGYLLYASLFAAIGSAVDSEADTQQFMLPVTIPLILAIFLSQFIINNPDGPISFWLSMIPLTSPIVMMIRIPFGVPYLQLVLSAVLLILGFLGSTWLAAKIYRTGILMYGKKVSYKELWKWLTYKG